jgi:hypothetical protein
VFVLAALGMEAGRPKPPAMDGSGRRSGNAVSPRSRARPPETSNHLIEIMRPARSGFVCLWSLKKAAKYEAAKYEEDGGPPDPTGADVIQAIEQTFCVVTGKAAGEMAI